MRKREWTPERQQAASVKAKALFAALPESVREERRQAARAHGEKGLAAYAEKYPERIRLSNETKAAIADGTLIPGPCDDCGKPDAQPEFDYSRLALSGWSHYDCRKVRTR